MIALEQVSLTLGEFTLRDITLRIKKGEYLVILGPSGAGKTVLLEVIAGLRAVDSGTVSINGRDVSGVLPEHRGTALVYQDYSLFPHMTAAENIAYGLKIQRKSVQEITKRVDAMLADLGISSLKHRYPASLSGGEQQRVAIARALAVKPQILLLDEPFAALDPGTREECMRLMMAVKKSQGLTIIQVSHSREEAYGLSDRVALIIDGSLIQTGTADSIFHDPQSPAAAKYAGIDNIFRGTILSCDGTYSVVESEGHQIILKGIAQVGTLVTICIAAENISIARELQVSADNRINTLSGIVSDILPMEQCQKIRIAGGIHLNVVVKQKNGSVYTPVVGDPCVAFIQPENVRLLEEKR